MPKEVIRDVINIEAKKKGIKKEKIAKNFKEIKENVVVKEEINICQKLDEQQSNINNNNAPNNNFSNNNINNHNPYNQNFVFHNYCNEILI